jgi:hypothetical protein
VSDMNALFSALSADLYILKHSRNCTAEGQL